MALVPFSRRIEAAASEGPRRGLQPVVGWRVWALRDGRLASWATRCTWETGENVARCLIPPRPMGCIGSGDPPCLEPPGRGCGCGFWGVFSPLDALKRARSIRQERNSVLGLMRGRGSIALHGSEGFRAQRAEVLCLFRDWCWDSPVLWGRRGGIRCEIGLRTWHLRAVPPAPSRVTEVEAAACTYGVPLLSLKAALTHGVLAEFGLGQPAQSQIRTWLELSGSDSTAADCAPMGEVGAGRQET